MKRVTFDPKNPPPLTPTEEEALAKLDRMADSDIDTSDIPPLTDGAFRRGYTSRLARRAREATGLTQAVFADRYGLPVATLRDWEQGKREADAAAKNYLRLIAEIPDVVAKTLKGAA